MRERENWEKRMCEFGILIESVIMYGAEICGWIKYKELEGLHMKSIRNGLKLDKTTSSHMFYLETKRKNIITKTSDRAIEYEEKR